MPAPEKPGVLRILLLLCNACTAAVNLKLFPFRRIFGVNIRSSQAGLNNLRSAGYTEEFISLEEGVGKYYEQLSATDGRYI